MTNDNPIYLSIYVPWCKSLTMTGDALRLKLVNHMDTGAIWIFMTHFSFSWMKCWKKIISMNKIQWMGVMGYFLHAVDLWFVKKDFFNPLFTFCFFTGQIYTNSEKNGLHIRENITSNKYDIQLDFQNMYESNWCTFKH